MKILTESFEVVPIDSVSPHPRNVNQGDAGAIYESITENGFFGAIVVQRSTGHILAGSHRWKAARDAGASEIPATFVDVDDERALRIMLADNRTARLGMDDPQALADLLTEILQESGSLAGTGFDADDLDALIEGMRPAGEGEWGEVLGALPDGDRAPFQQKTFTLHDEQVEVVERALEVAKGMGPFVDSPNENSNGNSLSRVAEMFLLWHGEMVG